MPKKYRRLIRYFKKHKIDLIIFGIALLTALISLIIYIQTDNQLRQGKVKIKEINQFAEKKTKPTNQAPAKIVIDLSGAVAKPALYEMKAGDRINDLLKKSGGLAKNADRNFFARNFNLANLLVNGEKIYVPSYQEIRKGLFQEPIRIIDYNNGDRQENSQESPSSISNRININKASPATLETLPGIGATTAEKIIAGRPYRSIQELLTRKILTQSVFNKIKEKVVN